MAAFLQRLAEQSSLPVLLLVIAVLLLILSKGADLLVTEAVILSLKWHMPKVLVGATVVSIGTTMPEVAVSVLAALKGHPGLALGNAVGSVICDTGLILGIATLMKPLPIIHKTVNRQGRIQFAAGCLLVLACFPWEAPGTVFSAGGNLPRFMGWIFLLLLGAYLWVSVRWARGDKIIPELDIPIERRGNLIILLKLMAGAFLVVASSRLLLPFIEETARRFNVPDSIIAATLVAFGTSLPELVTAITAVRRGHGELALGNVIGADILNVLFVSGAAAAVTSGGLMAPPRFFILLFPAMLVILSVFRIGLAFSRDRLNRWVGAMLLTVYLAITVLGYILKT